MSRAVVVVVAAVAAVAAAMRDQRRWRVDAELHDAWSRLTDVAGWARAWPAVHQVRDVAEGTSLQMSGPRPVTLVLEARPSPSTHALSLRFVRGELRHLDAKFSLAVDASAPSRGCWLSASVELAFPVVIPASMRRDLEQWLLVSWYEAYSVPFTPGQSARVPA